MNILVITATVPEKILGGGGTAVRSFLSLLYARYTNNKVEVLALQAQTSKIPHRLRQLLALLRSLFSPLSSKSLYDFNAYAAKRLQQTLKARQYDAVVINGGELFFILDYLPAGMKTLGIAHNVENRLFADYTQNFRKLPLLGKFFEQDLRKLCNSEKRGVCKLDKMVCLSATDAKYFKGLLVPDKILTLATSFSGVPGRRKHLQAGIARPLELAFLARYDWAPNFQSARWLIFQVIRFLPPGCVRLLLYGPGAHKFSGQHPNVKIVGAVKCLDVVWQADFMVCPVFSGSGINIKFVEALYNRCPVLATRYAARGLPEIDDPAVIFLETAPEWINFLKSKAAEELAVRQPSAELAETFSHTRALKTLQTFLKTWK